MDRLADRWLLQARITHPWTSVRFEPAPKAGAKCVSSARWDLRGEPLATAVASRADPGER